MPEPELGAVDCAVCTILLNTFHFGTYGLVACFILSCNRRVDVDPFNWLGFVHMCDRTLVAMAPNPSLTEYYERMAQ